MFAPVYARLYINVLYPCCCFAATELKSKGVEGLTAIPFKWNSFAELVDGHCTESKPKCEMVE